uniref:Uncharacterized protein n=1 Tax=Avena sativa TaxID=4498 RepID=A0ACD5TYV0_AVESA
MDLEANSAQNVLERMLIDKNAKPRDLRLSLLEDITDHFSPVHEIGRGGFAVVYKGMVGERMVAVKKLSKTYGTEHEDKFHKEIECLMKAKHKNIVRFLGYCVDTQGRADSYEGKFIIADLRTWLLCFEYVPNGNLQKYITDASGGLEWSLRFRIIKGICEGLHYLHMNSIIHLDLKPSNILLDGHMVPKIADFGLSRFLIEDKTHYTTKNVAGTPGYMAPEFYGGKVSFASDMYSLGVIIMEMLTGVKGYQEDDIVIESWMNRLEGATQLEQVRACTKMGKECMESDPKKRPVAWRIIDMLDKTGTADKTSMSSLLVEPQASLLGEQSNQKGIGKLTESLNQEDINERLKTKDVAERLVNDHQKGQENTGHLSSRKSQDTDRKANHKGKSIQRFNSRLWQKLNIFNIFRKDSPKNASSSGAAMSNSSSYALVAPVPRSEGEIRDSANIKAFTFSELRTATRNFRPDNVLGEGGFGSVFKGWIHEKTLARTKPGTGMVIAVKKLNLDGFQGHSEWQNEVNYLGQLSHPNLVKLVGYCVEDEQRFLVYEFMPHGSLENHLFRRGSHFQPISWSLRMKIAHGAAKGLAFLHSDMVKAILRSLKTSDILLDANYDGKLSDFGLVRDGPTGDNSHVSSRVMGTYGYVAPEYIATGRLTTKCDVFSFGVVLLEMMSGRRALDRNRPEDEHNLVEWATPYLKSNRRLFRVLDARLDGQYSLAGAKKAASLVLQCLSMDPRHRPTMEQVVAVLEQLHDPKEEGDIPRAPAT